MAEFLLDPVQAARLHRRLGDDLQRMNDLMEQVKIVLCDMGNALTVLYGINHFTCDAWIWPLDVKWTTITGYFGDERGTWVHEGVDIAVPLGQPVYAPHAGVVISAKFNAAYGNRVRLEWSQEGVRWWVWLAHLISIAVIEGHAVMPGDVIGLSGETGNATGPHLHMTVQCESNHELLRGIPEVLRGCINPLTVLSIP